MRILTFFLLAPFLCLAQGTITTITGKGTVLNADGGPAANSAPLALPTGVVVDGAGNIYIAEDKASLRKVNTSGIISTLASGLGPYHVALDSAGNAYVAEDLSNLVQKVSPSGAVTTIAGTRTTGYAGDGGPATKAWLNVPRGIAVDAKGNVYIADSQNHRIRMVDTSGNISTIAGTGAPGFSGDGGPAKTAQIYDPHGLAVDAAGNLFIADYQNGRVRKVDANGIITTVAGNGSAVCCSGEGGQATKAPIPLVECVAVDKAGNFYIGQSGRVAKVDASGVFKTIAGLGLSNDDNISATSAYLPDTPGIAVDSNGTLYIATGFQGQVRKVTFPSVPSISSAVNGASFQSPLVANSWATILGTTLASLTDSWDKAIVNGKLPTTLDGVTVTVGGKPAYLQYISAGQINLIVPDVAVGQQAVMVTNASGQSTFTATVSQYGPAFFAWPGNQAVATRQDFSWTVRNATFSGVTTVPAKPGDVIILWGTGFGPTNPPAGTGALLPSDQTYSTTTLPAISINGVSATVYGAALAPGFAGLYQIAIQVPPSLADGDWPLLASIGGVSSPGGIFLSVRK